MRRIGLAVTSAVMFCLLVAAPALAGSGTGSGIVAPQGGGTTFKGAGGTAFTGAGNISLGMLIVAALLIVGVASLLVSRRRAAATR